MYSQAQLIEKMIAHNLGDGRRIQHFLKVYAFAQTIGILEKLDAQTQHILETAAIVHDIGIRVSMEKFGTSNGKLQEQEGPAAARKMLCDLAYPEEVIERVCYLVGHHHTYHSIDGLDYQILVEADFLVNLHEKSSPMEAVREAYDHIFRTESGRRICSLQFGL